MATVARGYVSNLTDLTLGQVRTRVVLIGATNAGGGRSIWDVGSLESEARLLASYAYPDAQTHLAEAQAIMLDRPGGGISVLTTGITGGARDVRMLGADGVLSGTDQGLIAARLPDNLLHAGSFTSTNGTPLIWTADHDTPAFRVWRQMPDGRLSYVATSDAPSLLPSDAQIDSIVPLRIGGAEMILSASTRGNFISTHLIGSTGTIGKGVFLGSARGTGFNGPRDIAAVEVDGKHYALVSSAYSSSLTTLRVLPGGNLVPVDHIVDELATRFKSATVMETVQIDGRAFVILGGADDGLSLFTLTPDGRLIHLDTIADSSATQLANVSALAVRVIDGRIVAFAASATETGVSQFVIDPGQIGMTRSVGAGISNGTDSNDLIQGGLDTTKIMGGKGDDILICGSRSIALVGGAGADTFVPLPVAGRVAIKDFELGVDRMDLSLMGMIRSTYQLRYIPQAWGIRIQAGETRIDIYSSTGKPLSAASFDNAMFPVAHYLPPNVRSTILGTAAGDLMQASAGGSTVHGFGGHDTIIGSEVEDYLTGGTGDDRLTGLYGEDTIWGGAGNDSISGGGMNDLVLGGDDHDTILGEAGDDRLAGQAGNDLLSGGDGDDRLNGGGGDDVLEGGAGNDRLFGLTGDDEMNGGAGDDIMLDADGNNLFRDLEGNNMMFAGAGRDRMFAGPGNDTMRSGAGDDSLVGGGGRDNMQSGEGNDTVLGEDGDDLIMGVGGDDWLYGGAGNDMIFGGAGNDQLAGATGDDVLMGESGNDTLLGGAGNDTLRGHGGDDQLYADDGDDRLIGGTGTDTLDGGAGNDLLMGDSGRDVLIGGAGNDIVDGGLDADDMWGDSGEDRLIGGGGNDAIRGGTGHDTVLGGADHDSLLGEGGDDQIEGEDGNDSLDGGAGADVLTGGTGADVFIFADRGDASRPIGPAGTYDTITDFTHGQDRIDLSAFDVTAVTAEAFSGRASEVRWWVADADVLLGLDVDGDKAADLLVLLRGVQTLSADDFIL